MCEVPRFLDVGRWEEQLSGLLNGIRLHRRLSPSGGMGGTERGQILGKSVSILNPG